MKPRLKKVAMYAMAATLPVMIAGDITVASVLGFRAVDLQKQKQEIIAEFQESDVFRQTQSSKYNEYCIKLDMDEISQKQFQNYIDSLEQASFVEKVMLEEGSDEQKAKLNDINSKIDDNSKVRGVAGSLLVLGTAAATVGSTIAMKEIELEKDEKKRKVSEETNSDEKEDE